MDPAPAKYQATPAAVAELVAAHPFGWVICGAGEAFHATPLPLRARLAADGRIEALIGHFARSNPQVGALRRDPDAHVLIMGPHGYVSPSWLADRTQAPTWNYASAQFRVTVEFIDDETDLRAVLDDLVAAMERGRPDAWSAADMGERYQRLSRRIVAFVATVDETRGVFKLGQDESDGVFADALAGLEAEGANDLAAWMRAANPGRPGSDAG